MKYHILAAGDTLSWIFDCLTNFELPTLWTTRRQKKRGITRSIPSAYKLYLRIRIGYY